MLRVDAFVNANKEKKVEPKKETIFSSKIIKEHKTYQAVKEEPKRAEGKRWFLDAAIYELDRSSSDEKSYVGRVSAHLKRDYDFLKNFDIQYNGKYRLKDVFNVYMENTYIKADQEQRYKILSHAVFIAYLTSYCKFQSDLKTMIIMNDLLAYLSRPVVDVDIVFLRLVADFIRPW